MTRMLCFLWVEKRLRHRIGRERLGRVTPLGWPTSVYNIEIESCFLEC